MLRAAHVVKGVFLSVFTIQAAIWLMDWAGRWQWLTDFLRQHPLCDKFAHSPVGYAMVILLILGSASAEKLVKLPRIKAQLVNAVLEARVSSVPMSALFSKDAWDETHPIDWDWFWEVTVVNQSEIPTTIESVRVRLSPRRGYTFRAKVVRFVNDLTGYRFDNQKADFLDGGQDRPIPSLMSEIRRVPLTRGVGYRGWMRFEILQATRAECNALEIRAWLVDSFGQPNEIEFKKNSDKKWEKPPPIVQR